MAEMSGDPNYPNDLESIIDRYGLWCTLEKLELLCFEKAAHIRCDFQDEDLARKWERAGRFIGQTARGPIILAVS
jgi:hypothetical protein